MCTGKRNMLRTPPESALRAGERPARPQAIALSAALDSAVCCAPLVIAGIIAAASSLSTARVLLAGVAASLAAVGVLVAVRARTGSSPGHAAFGLRTTASTTGLPAWPFLTLGSRVTLDRRGGLDPLRLVPRAPRQAQPVQRANAPRRRRLLLQLHLDDGSALPIPGAVAIGRDARALTAIPQVQPLAILDFGHTLDAVHAVIEPAATGVRLHALSQQHPTQFAMGDQVHRLEPGHAVDVPLTSPFWLGDRRFAVHEIIPTRQGWAVAR